MPTRAASTGILQHPFLLATLVGHGVAGVLIFLYAPTEVSMGPVQRILYLHVAVAWCGLAGCLFMGAAGATYLVRRDLSWDRWSQAAAEIGWLCATLTLATGSIWAKEAWGVWWTWEPRLTSMLVLWLVFAGVFLARSAVDDPHRRARIGAVLALICVADVPLVLLATRWFRGVHPVTPDMDPRMRVALFAAVLSFSAFFLLVAMIRCRQLRLLDRVAELETNEHGFLHAI